MYHPSPVLEPGACPGSLATFPPSSPKTVENSSSQTLRKKGSLVQQRGQRMLCKMPLEAERSQGEIEGFQEL